MWISFCLSLASQFMIFLCVCHSLENPAGSMYALAGKGLNLSVYISVEINPWPQTPLFNQFWLIFRIVLKEGFHYGMQRFCAHVETHVYPSSLLLSLLFHLPLRLQLCPVAFLVCSFLCSLLPSFLHWFLKWFVVHGLFCFRGQSWWQGTWIRSSTQSSARPDRPTLVRGSSSGQSAPFWISYNCCGRECDPVFVLCSYLSTAGKYVDACSTHAHTHAQMHARTHIHTHTHIFLSVSLHLSVFLLFFSLSLSPSLSLCPDVHNQHGLLGVHLSCSSLFASLVFLIFLLLN